MEGNISNCASRPILNRCLEREVSPFSALCSCHADFHLPVTSHIRTPQFPLSKLKGKKGKRERKSVRRSEILHRDTSASGEKRQDTRVQRDSILILPLCAHLIDVHCRAEIKRRQRIFRGIANTRAIWSPSFHHFRTSERSHRGIAKRIIRTLRDARTVRLLLHALPQKRYVSNVHWRIPLIRNPISITAVGSTAWTPAQSAKTAVALPLSSISMISLPRHWCVSLLRISKVQGPSSIFNRRYLVNVSR